GGLFTATLLTLIVLPVLYAIFDKAPEIKNGTMRTLSISILLLAFPALSQAQTVDLTLEQAIATALENNAGIRSAALQVEKAEELIGSSLDLDKTRVFHRYDQNELGENGYPNKVWGLGQDLEFPTVYGARKKVYQSTVRMRERELSMSEMRVTKEVSKAFTTWCTFKTFKKTTPTSTAFTVNLPMRRGGGMRLGRPITWKNSLRRPNKKNCRCFGNKPREISMRVINNSGNGCRRTFPL